MPRPYAFDNKDVISGQRAGAEVLRFAFDLDAGPFLEELDGVHGALGEDAEVAHRHAFGAPQILALGASVDRVGGAMVLQCVAVCRDAMFRQPAADFEVCPS